MRRASLVAALLLCGLAGAQAPAPPPGLFPFVLPWDDDTQGVSNLSNWLPKPAGKFGQITADDEGHLRAGDQRIRFFGTDLSFAGNLPRHADAEKIARRMARFGINIVRFHIMDMRRWPSGLFAADAKDTRSFEPEALDRLDYFVSQLKANGIYANLNLLCYRPFNAADGLDPEIENLGSPYQERHVPGFWLSQPMLDLQQEYARNLLTHVNAYTGLPYTAEPAVAFVEINNENGLLSAWNRGRIEVLPARYQNELRTLWNGWLAKRYGNDAKLAAAWAGGAQPLVDQELLPPSPGLEGWQLQNNHGAESTLSLSEDHPEGQAGPTVRVDIARLGSGGWQVLLNRPGFGLRPGQACTVTFWAKADAPRKFPLQLCMTHEPWSNLAPQMVANLTAAWQRFEFVVTTRAGDPAARFMIGDLNQGTGSVWLHGLSLRAGGVNGLAEGEGTAAATVPLLITSVFDRRTPGAQRDWLQFLRETETGYWTTMRTFLKQELGVKALIIATAAQYSTPNTMDHMDAVDAHAYWQHPSFPGRPWDPNNWYVNNVSMASYPGGMLPGLALRRVANKPFCTTEYGSPSPNTHGGEGPLLVAAYGALQDWDYVSISRYTDQVDDRFTWGSGHFRRYFDVDQHPSKMMGFIPAVAMFCREDVRAAAKRVILPFGAETELAAIQRRASPWQVLDPTTLGLAPETMLLHRVALATADQPTEAVAPPGLPADGRFRSDTAELLWDLSEPERGVVTVNTARSKAVIGYGGGHRYDLGNVTIEPGPTVQEGWSTITLTTIDGDFAKGRALITATGYVENTNMGWKDAERTTVGKDWGTAPTMVEGIPANITLPSPAAATKVWALDERGQRSEALTVEAGPNGRAMVRLGPAYRTLWYELEVGETR